MKSILTAITACFVLLFSQAQNQIVEAEFYIDQDPGFGNATEIDISSAATITESFTANFEGLETGSYFVYLRVKDENDNWSIPLKVLFRVQRSDPPDITAVEWYSINDPGFGNGNSINVAAGPAVEGNYSAGTMGFPPIRDFTYLRCQNEDGSWSIPLKMPFHVQRAPLPEITAAEWYIGDDPGFGSATSIDINAGQTVEDLVSTDTDGLTAGRDFAYLRFQNANGSWSIPLKKGFMVNDKFPLDVVAAEYFIDEDPGFGMGIPVAVSPDHFVSESYLAELSLDLEIGDHFLYTRVQNEEGAWSIQVVRSFSVGAVSTEEEELLNSTKVYPNPATDLLNIENEVYRIMQVRLFDANGKAIDALQLVNDRLDLRGVASGIYLLQIETEGGRLSRKIVVQ